MVTCTLDASGTAGQHSYFVIRNLPEGAVIHYRGLALGVVAPVPPGLPGVPGSCSADAQPAKGAQPAKDDPAPCSGALILDAALQSVPR